MKKLIVAIVMLWASMASAQTYVSTTGSDSNPCTLASPCLTLAHAIVVGTTGTIYMLPGTYHNVSVTEPNPNITITSSTGFPSDVTWDGAIAVTGFTGSGPYVATGWTNTFHPSPNATSNINPTYPLAVWPDQVFFDGAPLNIACDPKNGPYPATLATARTITDGVLGTSTVHGSPVPTITSASAAFTSADLGKVLLGTGIPSGTFIFRVLSATSVWLNQSVTPSSGVTVQILGSQFCINYQANTISISDNPAGHTIEASNQFLAINLNGNNDVLSYITFKNYSPNYDPAQFSEIEVNGANVTINGIVDRYTANKAIQGRTVNGLTISNSDLEWGSEGEISGYLLQGANVFGNTLSYSNYKQYFVTGNDTAGLKFARGGGPGLSGPFPGFQFAAQTTSGANTLVATSPNFIAANVAQQVTGAGIPATNTDGSHVVIASVTDSTHATMTANATANGTPTITITSGNRVAFNLIQNNYGSGAWFDFLWDGLIYAGNISPATPLTVSMPRRAKAASSPTISRRIAVPTIRLLLRLAPVESILADLPVCRCGITRSTARGFP